MTRSDAIAELRKARAALTKCQDKIFARKKEVDLLESRIEAGEYPEYRWEDFKNDDLVQHAKLLAEIEELEAKEAELRSDVLAWRNTVHGA